MAINLLRITENAAETQEFGRELGHSYLKNLEEGEQFAPRVLCLYGPLGSGKTTFIQGFAKGVGIRSRLLSPTFIIVRRYRVPKFISFLFHIDLYRVKEKSSLFGLGISEILFDDHSISLIEWAERLNDLLPERRLDVYCELLEGERHKIKIHEV
jgi:tRNA threonylcarbamoyladenosine biosynthesis protein TsaE